MANRGEVQNKGAGRSKDFRSGTSHKGMARVIRANKRSEAENRNSRTAPDKRRAFWKERGFKRQSQAASLVTTTVTEINEQAKIHKQRSEDWPMVPDLG